MQILNSLKNYKFVMWGLGTIGKPFLMSLDNNMIIAIIESNPELIGTSYNEIPIISFEEYQNIYSDYIIIITPVNDSAIIELLKKVNLTKYFRLMECPQECWARFGIDFIDSFPLPISEHINAVYGTNLYSIALFYFWEQKGYKNIKFIKSNAINDEVFNYFQLNKNAIYLPDLKKNDIVYFANASENQKLALKNQLNSPVFDIFDSSIYNEKVNSKLSEFKNAHKGQRCFIVATGPSLQMQDLDKLHQQNAVCFSMNNIMAAFSKTNWRPNYYAIMDATLIGEYKRQIIESEIPVKFVGSYCADFWDCTHRSNVYEFNSYFEGVSNNPNENPKFSKDLTKRAYWGYTVTYTCIQFAIYMGFKEIYLLGVDFNYPKGADVKSLHYSKDYYNKDSSVLKTGNKANVAGMLKSYKKAKQVADELGIKIYNATRGGCLEVFERVDFDSLFEK